MDTLTQIITRLTRDLDDCARAAAELNGSRRQQILADLQDRNILRVLRRYASR